MKAVRMHEVGGPEKLRWEAVPLPHPKAGEVRVKVEAAGVNFIDIYQRSGLYPVTLPHILGSEIAGTVTALGEGVTDYSVGDHVASAKASGGYAEEAIVPVGQLVRVPIGITSPQAAAALVQGMTAHYLACDTFPLKPGLTILLHAAAGGVGLLLTQIAKIRGATVIGVVGSAAKVAAAKGAGVDEVIVATNESFMEAARRVTGGKGVDVVYDSVGKDTWEGSIGSLRPRGMMVSFGNASGPVPPFAPLLLSQEGSLFLTRPTLAHYTLTLAELRARAGELFEWILAGKLNVTVGATFPMDKAADAHAALAGRGTTGKVLLTL